jgi:two-component system response regulator YesN
MYKVMIVDDEEWVVESIMLSIDWRKFDFEVVGCAYNGMEAFEKIKQLMPDVVLTDIRMPRMNGLELINKVNELHLDICFIIISAYAEFSYAIKALNFGALGYCLKPIDNIELIKVLEKAKSSFKKSHSSKSLRLFDMILNYEPDMDGEVISLLKSSGLECSNIKGIVPMVSIGQMNFQFPQGLINVSENIGRRKYAYLIQAENMDNFRSRIAGEPLDEYLGAGIGFPAKTIAELKDSLDEANIAAYQYFISGIHNLFQYTSNFTLSLDRCITKISELVRYRSTDLLIAEIKEVPGLFKENDYNIKHAFYFYNMLTYYLYQSTEELSDIYLYSFEQLPNLYENIDEMIISFEKIIKKLFEKKIDKNVDEINNKTMRSILADVNENYCNELSLLALAKKYYINPSYISQLFKKELGKNFTDYILSLRIKRACELLSESNMSLPDVSQKIGYNDYFYFSKVFKKVVGQTPSQYREISGGQASQSITEV